MNENWFHGPYLPLVVLVLSGIWWISILDVTIKETVIQTRGLQVHQHRKYNELLSITVGVKRPLPWGKSPPRGRLALGRGASCPTHGASCPFGNASFKFVLYKNVYTHSSWNWHICSTNRALSRHKNIECSSKVCDQEVHQTLKGGVLPHPTLHLNLSLNGILFGRSISLWICFHRNEYYRLKLEPGHFLFVTISLGIFAKILPWPDISKLNMGPLLLSMR